MAYDGRGDRRRGRSTSRYDSSYGGRNNRRRSRSYSAYGGRENRRRGGSPSRYNSSYDGQGRRRNRSNSPYGGRENRRRSRSSHHRYHSPARNTTHFTVVHGSDNRRSRSHGRYQRRSRERSQRRRSRSRDRSPRRRSRSRSRSHTHAVAPQEPVQSAWPYTITTYDQPPDGSWAALSKAQFVVLWEENQNTIVPMPKDRNTIYHALCKQVHAPEFCRGPLKGGALKGCIFCGGIDHITDHCMYFLLVPKLHHDNLRIYLYVFARGGLPPVRSLISFHRVPNGPRSRCKIAVLSRSTARTWALQQNDISKQTVGVHWFKRFDYSRLDFFNEIHRLPNSCRTLKQWFNRGPLPNRVGAIFFDQNEYGPDHESEEYNFQWTVFSNTHVRPGPPGTLAVFIPGWVEMDNNQGVLVYSEDVVEPFQGLYAGQRSDIPNLLPEMRPVPARLDNPNFFPGMRPNMAHIEQPQLLSQMRPVTAHLDKPQFPDLQIRSNATGLMGNYEVHRPGDYLNSSVKDMEVDSKGVQAGLNLTRQQDGQGIQAIKPEPVIKPKPE